MFIVVTVICLWLGWQVHRVRQRVEIFHWLADHWPEWEEPEIIEQHWWIELEDSNLPWHRGVLGDHWVFAIRHPINALPEDVDRVHIAFPEAIIQPGPDWHSKNALTAVVHARSADPFVTNGTAYDRASLVLVENVAIVVPQNTQIEYEYAERPGVVTVLMEKTMSYCGHPGTAITIDEIRHNMGFAYVSSNGTLRIAKYGEFSTGEGGRTIVLKIRVSEGTQVETDNGDLDMPKDRDTSGSPLQLSQDEKVSWCSLKGAEQRWIPISGEPDTASFANPWTIRGR